MLRNSLPYRLVLSNSRKGGLDKYKAENERERAPWIASNSPELSTFIGIGEYTRLARGYLEPNAAIILICYTAAAAGKTKISGPGSRMEQLQNAKKFWGPQAPPWYWNWRPVRLGLDWVSHMVPGEMDSLRSSLYAIPGAHIAWSNLSNYAISGLKYIPPVSGAWGSLQYIWNRPSCSRVLGCQVTENAKTLGHMVIQIESVRLNAHANTVDLNLLDEFLLKLKSQ